MTAVAAIPMNLLLNLDPLAFKLLGLLLIVPGLALALSVYGAVIVEQGIAAARFLSVGLSNLGYGLLSSWTLVLLIAIDKPDDTTPIWGIVLAIGARAGFVVSLRLRDDRAGEELEP